VTTSRVALNAYMDRRLRTFLWMKRLRREDILEELSRFPVPPVFKTTPWMHQLVCVYIGLCYPEFLFFLDMGLGKSKILSDLVTQRRRDKTLRRALITVPNVVNMASWCEDLERHSDLETWACAVENTAEKWDYLANPEGDITIIDYHGLMLSVCTKVKGKLVPNEKRIARVQKLYNFMGIDESHKLRNHQSLWFTVMRDLTRSMDYTYATTGTPFGKNPEAMWSQFYLVDRGDTFGDTLGMFREAFFGLSTDPHATWEFNRRTAPELNRMMQHSSIRYTEDEVPEIEIPKRMHITRHVQMTGEQRDHFLRALEGLINAQGTGDSTAMEAPWMRMRQIVSGYLIWKDATGDHKVVFKENPKLDALQAILTEAGQRKVVITHHYVETGRIITERLEKLGIKYHWLYGGTKDKAGARRKFMDDDSTVFLMNNDSGGTGNDGLQKVARYMVLYETPTVPDQREQVIKRLHRPGQKERVFVYDLVMRKSGDQRILDSIAEGRDLFDQIVNGRLTARSFLAER